MWRPGFGGPRITLKALWLESKHLVEYCTRVVGIADALRYPTETIEDSKRVAGGGTEY
jgi:hypothetical protein